MTLRAADQQFHKPAIHAGLGAISVCACIPNQKKRN
jgi:hypothetical protein